MAATRPDNVPNHSDLLNLLVPINDKWEHIGLALKVNRHIINGLRRNETDNTIRLSKILQAWIDKDKNITWETVAQAIEGPIVNNKALAREIRDRYVSTVSVPPSSTSQTTATTDGAQPIILMTKDQLKRLKQILKAVLKENEENLRPAINDSIGSIAQLMHQDGLITTAVFNAPTYDGIINSFQLSLGLKKSQQQIEEHCSKFINVLRSVGGPANDVATILHDEWTKEASKELSITLNISFKRYRIDD